MRYKATPISVRHGSVTRGGAVVPERSTQRRATSKVGEIITFALVLVLVPLVVPSIAFDSAAPSEATPGKDRLDPLPAKARRSRDRRADTQVEGLTALPGVENPTAELPADPPAVPHAGSPPPPTQSPAPTSPPPTPTPAPTSPPANPTPIAAPVAGAPQPIAPPPPATDAPTPPPVTGGLAVPSSIDSTGAADVSAALIEFVRSVPDGSTISFAPGGVYRLDSALKFSNRRNLVFAGNGATLKQGGSGTNEHYSLIALWGGNSGISVRDFNLVGASTSPGVFQGGREGAHAVLIDGGEGIDIANVSVSGVWGDAFYVGLWANNVQIHDSRVISAGRNGVTIIAGQNVTVERVTFDRVGYSTFDIEPNTASEGARNVRFINNTVGQWYNSFFSGNGASGSTVDGVTVSGNSVTGGTLLTVVDLPRRTNIVFTNNSSTVAAPGPVLRFANIDGLTIAGNSQPLISGELAVITNCTGVTYN